MKPGCRRIEDGGGVTRSGDRATTGQYEIRNWLAEWRKPRMERGSSRRIGRQMGGTTKAQRHKDRERGRSRIVIGRMLTQRCKGAKKQRGMTNGCDFASDSATSKCKKPWRLAPLREDRRDCP